MKNYKKNRSGKSCSKAQKGTDRFTKRQRQVESDDMRDYDRLPDVRSGGPNDWQWYARSPEMVKAAASFPYANAIGNRAQFGDAYLDVQAVPGIFTIGYAPTIGEASSETDPVSVAMRQIYSDVRHKNSGSVNYDAPDLMMYLLAMDSVYMYIAYLRRIYGTVFGYQAQNRYVPQALLQAMGVDYDDIQQNLPNLLWYINLLSAKTAGSLCIPNGMSYMARHSWMTSGMYMDSNTMKAQIYMYVPTAYLQLVNPTTQPEAVTQLQYVDAPGFGIARTVAKFKDLVNFGNQLINVLIANEDINIMSGDILKAYGVGGVVTLPALSDNYAIVPEYNQEVLAQFENATVIGSNMSGTISQATNVGTGYIIADYQTNITYQHDFTGAILSGTATNMDRIIMGNRMLNFHNQAITPELVMVATRMMLGIKTSKTQITSGTWSTTLDYYAVGSEVATYADMYRYYYTSSGVSLERVPFQTFNMMSSAYPTATAGYMRMATVLSNFDWHPAMFMYNYSVSEAGAIVNVASSGMLMDTDVNTYITCDNLRNMAETALLSEFWAPVANNTSSI